MTENNGIDVKTTDSGYMSPPEAHLDTDLHEAQPMNNVTSELSELHLGQKNPVRESELETYNSFNFWRVPLPPIGDEGGAGSTDKANTADPNNTSENPTSENSSEDPTGDNPNSTSEDPTTEQPSDELKPSADPTPGHPSEESKPSGEPTTDDSGEESKTPEDHQDLGISDMDIDEDLEKNEKDLTCDEAVDDSPKRMAPLSGIPSLRFDEEYLQPYSPNMCFDDETNRAPSPPRSPCRDQVSYTSCLKSSYCRSSPSIRSDFIFIYFFLRW